MDPLDGVVDRLADDFRRALCDGKRPSIEKTVEDAIQTHGEEIRSPLFRALLEVELVHRRRVNETHPPQHYYNCFPSYRKDIQAVFLALLADDFRAEWRGGKRPFIEGVIEGAVQAHGEDSRSPLFRALLEVEIEERRDLKETPTRQEYFDRFPALREETRAVFRALFGPSTADMPAPEATKGASRSGSPGLEEQIKELNDILGHLTRGPQAGEEWWVGRYRVIRKLGQGGLGVVLLAQDPDLPRKVALKVPFPKRYLQSPELANHILLARAEAQKQSSLPIHRGIAVVYGVECPPVNPDLPPNDALRNLLAELRQKPELWIAMEYVPGDALGNRTLEDRLTNGALQSHDAAELMLKIAEGVAHAHRHGPLIHRDLKPANILLDPAGWPKITDFGLAIAYGCQMTGGLTGTPEYMSPEQLRGEPLDPRSDVYSLGVIFYRMLTGKLPFKLEQDESFMSFSNRVKTLPALTAQHHNESVQDELSKICAGCLEKRPLDRPSTVDEMMRKLQGWLDSPGSDQRGGSFTKLVSSPGMARRAALPTGATLKRPRDGQAAPEPITANASLAAALRACVETRGKATEFLVPPGFGLDDVLVGLELHCHESIPLVEVHADDWGSPEELWRHTYSRLYKALGLVMPPMPSAADYGSDIYGAIKDLLDDIDEPRPVLLFRSLDQLFLVLEAQVQPIPMTVFYRRLLNLKGAIVFGTIELSEVLFNVYESRYSGYFNSATFTLCDEWERWVANRLGRLGMDSSQVEIQQLLSLSERHPEAFDAGLEALRARHVDRFAEAVNQVHTRVANTILNGLPPPMQTCLVNGDWNRADQAHIALPLSKASILRAKPSSDGGRLGRVSYQPMVLAWKDAWAKRRSSR